MKHIFSFVLLLAGCSLLWAQKPALTAAAPVKKKDLYRNYFIGAQADYYYSCIAKEFRVVTVPPTFSSFVIQKHRLDMKGEPIQEGKIKFRKSYGAVEKMLLGEDQLYLFLSSVEQREHVLKLKKIPLNSLADIGEPIEIMRVPLAKREQEVEFGIEMKNDQSAILIYALHPRTNKQSESLSISLFDGKMKKRWAKVQTLADPSEAFLLNQIKLGPESEVLIPYAEYLDYADDPEEIKTEIGEVEVSIFDEGGDEIKKQKIVILEPTLAGINIQYTPQKELVCGGLYTDEAVSMIMGSFFLRYDATSKLTLDTYSSLEEEIPLGLVTIEGEEENLSKVRYLIDHMILTSDGGALLVAEPRQRLKSTVKFTDGDNIKVYSFFVGPLQIIRLDGQGEISWQSSIKKVQIAPNMKSEISRNTLAGYQIALAADRLVFIYNQTIVQDNESGKLLNTYQGRRIQLTTLDSQGERKDYDLLPDKQEGYLFMRSRFVQYDNNSFLIRVDDNKAYQYIKGSL